jgi:hypothetical protein
VGVEQAKRLPPDGLSGLDLLAFPQSQGLVGRLHGSILAHPGGKKF